MNEVNRVTQLYRRIPKSFRALYSLFATGFMYLCSMIHKISSLNPVHILLILASVFFILGVVNILFLIKIYRRVTIKDRYAFQMTLTTILLAFGAILVHHRMYEGMSFLSAASSASLTFLYGIPLLGLITIQAHQMIPAPQFLAWYYPDEERIEDIDKIDLSQTLTITFEFKRKPIGNMLPPLLANAPEQMSLGELYYYLLLDYNYKNPSKVIKTKNDNGVSFGWLFYIRRPRFLFWHKFIMLDHQKKVKENGIKESDVIFVQRLDG